MCFKQFSKNKKSLDYFTSLYCKVNSTSFDGKVQLWMLITAYCVETRSILKRK